MKARDNSNFTDLNRNVTDNHFLYHKEHVDKKAKNPWTRPFKTSRERFREIRGKKRRVRDFFEEFSLKNLGAMLKWFWSWLKHRFKRTHKFVTYKNGNGIYRIPGEARILLASDWGTATPDAISVANKMQSLTPAPNITVHLGDVYYTGEKEEYHDYFFPHWPRGTDAKHPILLLNANHEMYSGGDGYFDYALKEVGQEASYFCVENKHWRIIGLDTGFHSVKADKRSVDKQDSKYVRLPKAILKWLRDEVFSDPTDQRGIIFLSHHQWFCAFGTEYHRPAQQLSEWVQKPVLWFWGHEHVFAAYGIMDQIRDSKDKIVKGIPVHARCIGHGGMPAQIDRLTGKLEEKTSELGRERELILWDRRKNRTDRDTELGFNGFVELIFKGQTLIVNYYDQNKVIMQEAWEATSYGVQGKLIQVDPELEPEPGRRFEELYEHSLNSQAA